MSDPRWTVDERHGKAIRLAFNARRAIPGLPWCDDLIVRHFEQVPQHVRLGPEAFDVLVAAVRESAEVPGLRAELDRIRPLIGMHDPTGVDHMEDAARLATENDALRERVADLEAHIRGDHQGHERACRLIEAERDAARERLAEAEAERDELQALLDFINGNEVIARAQGETPRNPPTCRHEESLYGRCTNCDLTWEQQAEAIARARGATP